MANIKLVIEIDEEDYEIMKHNVAVNNPLCPLDQAEMVATVANGTPIPEGCRLIDANEYRWEVLNMIEPDWDMILDELDNAPIIISTE